MTYCEWNHELEDKVPATIEMYDSMWDHDAEPEDGWTPACDECSDGNVARKRKLETDS